MKKPTLFYAIILFMGIMLGTMVNLVAAAQVGNNQNPSALGDSQQASATLIPTLPAVYLNGEPIPETRVLPPVGSNAGMVLGAIILVLIIIGGVLSARLKPKH